MKIGTILHDDQFQYDDGYTGGKLAVVVSDFGKNFLVVKTTSRQHRKNKARGCQINDVPPNYYLPANSTWFKSDTWLLLDEVLEIDFNVFSSKDTDSSIHPSLPQTVVKDLLECAIKSEDIEEFYLDFLRRSLSALP